MAVETGSVKVLRVLLHSWIGVVFTAELGIRITREQERLLQFQREKETIDLHAWYLLSMSRCMRCRV